MKFNLNHDPNNKTLAIPRAALQLSGLAGVSDLILHTDSGCVLLLPGDPTVAEMLKTISLLKFSFHQRSRISRVRSFVLYSIRSNPGKSSILTGSFVTRQAALLPTLMRSSAPS